MFVPKRLDFRIFQRICFMFALFVLCWNTAIAETSFQTDAKRDVIRDLVKEPGFFKTRGYVIYGGKYYFPDMEYPAFKGAFAYEKITGLKIKLANDQFRLAGADESGFVPLPAHQAVYFRAEYHLKTLDLGVSLESHLDEAIKRSRQRNIKKDYSDDRRQTILDKAKIHVVVFPADQFRLKYRPGTTLLAHDNGFQNKEYRNGNLRARIKRWYYRITGQDKNSLIGIFNGTFHNQDAVKLVNGRRRLPGLIVNGRVIDKPIGGLGTLAIYEDGRLKVGSWDSLPRKESVRFARQNEYLALESGRIAPDGAYPVSWTRFEDEILRSYLATTPKQDYFAYVWSTYSPPGLTAVALKQIGFGNLMLLDIHPVIAGILREPTTEPLVTMTRSNSYQFVPNEKEVVGFIARLVKGFRRRTIQWDHYMPLLKGGFPRDFLTVHAAPATGEHLDTQ